MRDNNGAICVAKSTRAAGPTFTSVTGSSPRVAEGWSRRTRLSADLMSRANCMPVHIRGKDYPSVNEAAAALGIKPASLSGYLSRYGHTEGVGLGCSSPARNKYPRNKKPVDIAGHQFATVKAAADALGVNYQALARTLKRPLSEKSARRLLRLVNAWKARKAAARLRSSGLSQAQALWEEDSFRAPFRLMVSDSRYL